MDNISKRYRFQFKVSKSKKVKLTDEYEKTGDTKNDIKFQNQALRDLVEELMEAEEVLHDATVPFIKKLFKKFYKKQHLWSNFIACIAELD